MKTWKAVIIRLIIETITIKYDFFFFLQGWSEIILWKLQEIHSLGHRSLRSGDFIPTVVMVCWVRFLYRHLKCLQLFRSWLKLWGLSPEKCMHTLYNFSYSVLRGSWIPWSLGTHFVIHISAFVPESWLPSTVLSRWAPIKVWVFLACGFQIQYWGVDCY